MANRINMVQKELLFSLFAQNWSNRKINKSIGLHRNTISRYRKEWINLRNKDKPIKSLSRTSDYNINATDSNSQSVPPNENKVPTEGVVHFEVPTDPKVTDKKISSKSKASVYHNEIKRKLGRGQHAVSIYQDLVCERGYSGSYDSIKRYVRKLKNKFLQMIPLTILKPPLLLIPRVSVSVSL